MSHHGKAAHVIEQTVLLAVLLRLGAIVQVHVAHTVDVCVVCTHPESIQMLRNVWKIT